MSEYYMLNKPSGCITARRDPRHKTVMDYFPEKKRDTLFPVGRLDKDTEGLLLVTDDGALAQRLLHPTHHVNKTYFFYAVGELSDDSRRALEQGIKLYPTKDIVTSQAEICVDGTTTLGDIRAYLTPFDLKKANRRPNTPVFSGRVTISEGKKHQVKRMLLFAGCRIIYLRRISMGALSLDPALEVGEYRPLTDTELSMLT